MNVGDKIPDFTLPDQNGQPVRALDLCAKGPVVFYFYPKDETLGCTAQACAFRDAIEDFKELNAQVVGISSDSPESHKQFAARHRLPFMLLSDRGGKVRKQFNVPTSFLGLAPGRVTYVVDSQGIIRHIYNSQINAKGHIGEALKALKK